MKNWPLFPAFLVLGIALWVSLDQVAYLLSFAAAGLALTVLTKGTTGDDDT